MLVGPLPRTKSAFRRMSSKVLLGLLAGSILPGVLAAQRTQGQHGVPPTTSQEITRWTGTSIENPPKRGRLNYPADPTSSWFEPFPNPRENRVGNPVANGAADMDGDGNPDLWFLAPTRNGIPNEVIGSIHRSGRGSEHARLTVHMARTSSLGRFRDWSTFADRTWVHGATFRSTAYTRGDRVLLVDPGLDTLISAYYTYPFGQSPRTGTFVTNASWQVGRGAYEIATRDDNGDGHDDIAVLTQPQAGWTRVKKLRMGDSIGWLRPESEVSFDMPLPAKDLRMLDFDGDGASDLVFSVPGMGVFVLRDDGPTLTPVLGIPIRKGLRQVFVGDADQNGLDDLGLVIDAGVYLVLSKVAGFAPIGLYSPQASGPLRTACVLEDRDGKLTSVAAFPASGDSIEIFPLRTEDGTFGPAQSIVPSVAGVLPTGPGIGRHLVVADIDNDTDQDVVVQLADRQHWVALRNGERHLVPANLSITRQGKIAETGFSKYHLAMQIPGFAKNLGLDEVELAIFLDDVTVQPSRYVYWGRLIGKVDPATGTVSFTTYTQTQPNRLKAMIQNAQAYPFANAITSSEGALMSIHFKQGPKRFESILVYHTSGGSGDKSAVGVKWKVRADPPKANMDTDLLPWN